MIHQAILKLYPKVVNIINDEAFDAQGSKVEYDLDAVTACAKADQETAQAAKQSALTKLTALGLTADEIKALIGN